MQDIRVDQQGDFRCWKCGGRSFDSKRTMKAKVTLGVGAVLTAKKLKCQACGEYNKTGNAKPWVGPGDKGPSLSERAETYANRKPITYKDRQAMRAAKNAAKHS